MKRLSSRPRDGHDDPQARDHEADNVSDGGLNGETGGKGNQERTYTLVLDSSRSVVVKAPLSIKQSELKRLQDWLALQLLVTPDQPIDPAKVD